MDSNEVEKIVKETYNLKTLQKWKNKAANESTRMLILNQIDLVEKYNTKDKVDQKNSENTKEDKYLR